ncbi:hypothetical protein MESS4_260048 [Mesorhizobium sp. STM 4661]|nr:hypothetical protein MESS4_260048 [Mesorhizobium sp. STM 4661]
MKRCSEYLSSSAQIATVLRPSSLAARKTRMAISDRLATSIFVIAKDKVPDVERMGTEAMISAKMLQCKQNHEAIKPI